jgi:hypothetical protein
MTFNTGNKWAHGIADSQPLSVLAEALGARIPAVAVPFVNRSLAGHPACLVGESGAALLGRCASSTPMRTTQALCGRAPVTR